MDLKQPTTNSGSGKVQKLNMPTWQKFLGSLILLADACVLPLIYEYQWAAAYLAPALALVTLFLLVWRVPDFSVAIVTVLPALLIWIVSGTYFVACLWVFMIAIIGGGAYLLRCIHIWIWFILPVAAFGISLAAVQNIWIACLSLLFFPAAYALYNAVATGQTRIAAIVFTAGALLLSLVAVTCLVLYAANGTLTAELAQSLIAKLKITCEDSLKSTMTATLETYQQFGYTLSVDASTYASELTREIFNLIPGIIILFTLIVGWCTQPMPYILHQRLDDTAPVPLNARLFLFGPLTGIIYIICQLPTFFQDISSSNATIVMANMALILMPGLCLSGLGFFFGRRIRFQSKKKQRGSSLPFIVFLMLIFMLFAGCSYAEYILIGFALYGAITSIIVAIKSYLLNHMDKS